MGKYCKYYGLVTYMDCLDCDSKLCRKGKGEMPKVKSISSSITDETYKKKNINDYYFKVDSIMFLRGYRQVLKRPEYRQYGTYSLCPWYERIRVDVKGYRKYRFAARITGKNTMDKKSCWYDDIRDGGLFWARMRAFAKKVGIVE
jgi:hypothetical protein